MRFGPHALNLPSVPTLTEALEDALAAIDAHRTLANDLERLAPGAPPQRPADETAADAFVATRDALLDAYTVLAETSLTAHQSALIAAQAPPRTPRLKAISSETCLEHWPDTSEADEWSFLAHPGLLESLAASEARINEALALLE